MKKKYVTKAGIHNNGFLIKLLRIMKVSAFLFIISVVQIKMKILWNLELINKERLLQIDNCVIAANHISLFDPPFIGSVFPKEIKYWEKLYPL